MFAIAVLSVVPAPSFSAIRADRWRWSNPAPHGNNVLDMKVSTDVAVQVGDAGALHVQRSDGRWAPIATATDNYLRSTTLLGDRIIATGESGTILWSDDGSTFEDVSLDTADWLEGVTASSQRAVAVGDEGSLYTSTNGVAWTQTAAGTTYEWLRGVAFGAGGFVAVGENGTILRASTSAASWSLGNSGTTEHLNRIRFLGGGSGAFYAVGNQGTLLRSDTGTAWSSMESGTTNDLYDVALNNTGLLLAGDQELRISIDGGASWVDQINELPTNAPAAWVYLSAHGSGTSWLVAGRSGLLMEGSCTNGIDCTWQPSPTDSSHVWLWDMTVQNGIYIAVGDLANIQTSLDGILWAQEVVPVSYTNTVLLGVGGTSNLLLAVGNDGHVFASQAGAVEVTVTNSVGTTNAMVGTYGVVWTNLATFTTNTLQGVAATDGLFIVSGSAGEIFTSPDGTNWTKRTTPTSNFLSSVAIGGGICIAVGDGGTVIRSADNGVSWSTATSGITTSDWLYRVRWMEGRFVIVGENGKIYTSSNGTSWTARASGTTKWLSDVAYVDSQWFVSGYQGTLLTSTNLADWSKLLLPTGKSLFSAGAKDGQLLLVGVEGVTLRNQVASKTSPVMLLDYSQSLAVDSNAVDTVYELFLFGGEPDQFFDFQSTTNLVADTWESRNGTLELYDSSGTLYAIRTRDATNAPPAEYYRTQLVP
jgi:hypothetical protein